LSFDIMRGYLGRSHTGSCSKISLFIFTGPPFDVVLNFYSSIGF